MHRKYAPSQKVFDLVFTHCQIVSDLSLELVKSSGIKVDTNLLTTAALLHDIGAYSLLDKDGELVPGEHYIKHGINGEKILKFEGYPKVIWQVASHHTGVGLTKNDVKSQNLPLPLRNYEARSDLELLIMYADKFHSKTDPPLFNSFEWYKQYVSRFGNDKSVIFEQMAEKFGKPDLKPLIKKYGYDIRSEV